MYDENLHIIPDPEKGYPEPEIPADEAWNEMAGMLDAAMPAPPSGNPPAPPETPPPASGGGFLGLSIKSWLIGLGSLGIIVLLTWGIVSLTSKPEKPAAKKESLTEAQNNPVRDSAVQASQDITITPAIAKAAPTVETIETVKQLPESKLVSEKNINPATSPKKDIKTGNNKESLLSSVPEPIKPARQAVREEPGSESYINGNPPQAFIPAADSVKPAEMPSPETYPPAEKAAANENPAVNAVSAQQQDNAQTPPEPGKVKTRTGMPENLSWQIGIDGNIGEVVQSGRDPNLFYGGMITGGIWNEKINGGIETGVGYEIYKDYGSITENIRADSIPADTLGNFQYLDSTRITAYKYQYQYIKVPLYITKQLLSKGRFSLDITTGPMVGFMISERKSLDYISGPSSGEILGTENKDYSRLSLSWQWHLIVPLRWNFSERLSLALSPHGIFYLNNLYDKTDRPAGMPFGMGINIGLTYRFR